MLVDTASKVIWTLLIGVQQEGLGWGINGTFAPENNLIRFF